MITLDYRTNNPRWGTSGMAYASWERFAFALGYLANEAHYRNKNDRGLIELHFESNDVQGAWGKEGRIQAVPAGGNLLLPALAEADRMGRLGEPVGIIHPSHLDMLPLDGDGLHLSIQDSNAMSRQPAF